MPNISVISKIKSFFIEKRWGIAAILIGTAVGLLSAVICIRGNIAIFGFNISFIISPLIAGYVETIIAQKKYGKTTGAISALLIFLIININSWVFPKDPISINFITLGGLGLAFQAAFPILVNYLIFVVFLGALTYLIGYLGTLLSKATYKITGQKPEENHIIPELIDLDKYGITAVTTTIKNKSISKNLGIISSAHIFKPDLKVINSKNGNSPNIFDQFEIARNIALADLMEKTKELGANAILEIEIDYTEIGGIKGSEILVNVSGNAILLEK
ncbi:heavy metal-binding domain-containing protein [Methanobacterium alcaliphilum]|uniref:heavy metal-binding domain-containing protein n=1 Tax=Methanobacterium alcaliphilum TaxID=392018 RepID=UPI00200A5C2D|nr:heavy metal-binding domain-containing protein [Methanobacterium alcaliphilum]MCK9150944.1 heavy metal-binding domain-containing protein [Methanobacterium alcaliphilum]